MRVNVNGSRSIYATTLIEVFYLPSYSPDLNPEKMFNVDLKANVKK
ncbi:MAG: transposase [Burkholderia sp.]